MNKNTKSQNDSPLNFGSLELTLWFTKMVDSYTISCLIWRWIDSDEMLLTKDSNADALHWYRVWNQKDLVRWDMVGKFWGMTKGAGW